MRRATLLLAALTLAGCGAGAPKSCLAQPEGMVRIDGGDFLMGAAPERPEEGPPHKVHVNAFSIDRTEVTNAEFARFVTATGYRTLAERGLSKAQYPNLTPKQRRPASLVFVGAKARHFDDPGLWWRIVPGADWRHPTGPGSSVRGKDDWPVVHIAYEDALAYARWLGRDLPTEAEWEYAARGGLDAKRYVWGDQPQDPAHPKANTWQGVFPVIDNGSDGYKASAAPVGCYQPNGYGLFDMAGNVW
ncbi:MAG TPA: formylglycine-generating enzyme family protein, partial [Caulobacteraceae bacterium]|nr:formylglycine-generating enzyme family protein [Caulobacteraceae bacterium]